MNAVEEDWTNGGWGWANPPAPPPAFICTLDSEGFAPLKKTAAKVQPRNPVPPVQTRNRFTRLASLREEEEANEDIPLCMVQCETAVEPYPAREDRIQDRTTEVTFRTSGKFTELGQEYERLAEAKGGSTKKPKKVRVTPPTVQVFETSAYDPKGSACTSTKTKYENQSKYLVLVYITILTFAESRRSRTRRPPTRSSSRTPTRKSRRSRRASSLTTGPKTRTQSRRPTTVTT